MNLYESINKNLKEYNEQLSLFPEEQSKQQNEVIERVTVNEETLDSVSLVRYEGQYGVGKNVCSIHDMGDTYFIADDKIEYFSTEEQARQHFEKVLKDEERKAAISWLQNNRR